MRLPAQASLIMLKSIMTIVVVVVLVWWDLGATFCMFAMNYVAVIRRSNKHQDDLFNIVAIFGVKGEERRGEGGGGGHIVWQTLTENLEPGKTNSNL